MPSICVRCREPIIAEDLLKCNGVCGQIFHYTCQGLRQEVFTKLQGNNSWHCHPCREKLKVGSRNKESETEAKDCEEEDEDIKSMLKKIIIDVKKIDAVDRKLDVIFEKVHLLENEVSVLKEENLHLTSKLNNLQESVDILEQRSRMMNIEVKGIPITKNENCSAIIADVAKAVGIQVNKGDIQIAHRVPNKGDPKGKAIIAQLSSRAIRMEWVKKFKEGKGLTANKVNRAFNSTPVYVNEHLTTKNKILLQESKNFAKANNIKYVWVSDNNILMRKSEGSKIRRIRQTTDLSKMIEDR